MGAILTVTLNPAIDVSTSVERVAPSVKLRCAPERRDPGGGGINVARVAHRLGARAVAAHTSGGLPGKLLERLIEQEAVESIVLPVSGDTREDFTVLETSTAREYRFVLPGPMLGEPEWRDCLAQISALEHGCELVVLSGSLPPGAPVDAYASLARIAKKAGARVTVDASGEALRAALDEGVFLIKPSLDELSGLLGVTLPDEPSRLRAARDIIAAGSAEVVVLSLSEEGAMLVTKSEAWMAKAGPIKVTSSIGAGDSFVGAMVWGLGASLPLDECLRYGVAAGSATLMTPGTELCEREDVLRLLPEVTLRPI